MKKFSILLMSMCSCSFLWAEPVSTRIDKIIAKHGINKKSISLVIRPLLVDKEDLVYQLNSDDKFIPASLTKIITAAAVLNKFPKGHKFNTRIMTNGKINGKILEGSLYLVGGGDPGFVSESMWVLVNDLIRQKFKIISGDIFVDDTFFDNNRFDTGRDPERVDRAYDAPIGAMSFNWNSVNIYLKPTKPGKPVSVFADPASQYIQIKNNAKTTTRNKSYLNIHKKPLKNGDLVIIDGTLGESSKEKVVYRSISKPDYWSGYQLVSFLSQRGIQVRGDVKLKKHSSSFKQLANKKSKPLAAIVKDMMKFSNNYVAEMLTKALPTANGDTQGTMSAGIKQIIDYLNSIGIKSSQVNISSPSGLSRKNKISATGITHILLDMYKNKSIYPEFLASLPSSGVDGTLKRRFKKPSLKGVIRAKTGRLNGVSGLAGYIKGKYVFAFMFNGKNKNLNKANKLIDEIVEEMANE